VPVSVFVIGALFQIGAILGQGYKRFMLGWRFGRLRGKKIEHGLVPLFGLRCAFFA
jgi:hypothetical protein